MGLALRLRRIAFGQCQTRLLQLLSAVARKGSQHVDSQLRIPDMTQREAQINVGTRGGGSWFKGMHLNPTSLANRAPLVQPKLRFTLVIKQGASRCCHSENKPTA
jgi:hypothetical protein